MNEGKKFLGKPKHAFDFGHQLKVSKKIDALLNGKIVDESGNVVGKIHYADGNTVFQIQAGNYGWHFGNKIEVDPTVYYPAQTVIHIQPTNDLVTTGIRDAADPTGPLITSCAGFWVSTQAVQPKRQVSGNDVWDLPQFPLPVGTNVDDKSNFWLYLGEMNP